MQTNPALKRFFKSELPRLKADIQITPTQICKQLNPTLIFEYTLAFLQFWFALKRSLKVNFHV